MERTNPTFTKCLRILNSNVLHCKIWECNSGLKDKVIYTLTKSSYILVHRADTEHPGGAYIMVCLNGHFYTSLDADGAYLSKEIENIESEYEDFLSKASIRERQWEED